MDPKNLPAIKAVAGHLLGKGINLSRQDTLIHRDIFAFLAKDHRNIKASAT